MCDTRARLYHIARTRASMGGDDTFDNAIRHMHERKWLHDNDSPSDYRIEMWYEDSRLRYLLSSSWALHVSLETAKILPGPSISRAYRKKSASRKTRRSRLFPRLAFSIVCVRYHPTFEKLYPLGFIHKLSGLRGTLKYFEVGPFILLRLVEMAESRDEIVTFNSLARNGHSWLRKNFHRNHRSLWLQPCSIRSPQSRRIYLMGLLPIKLHQNS